MSEDLKTCPFCGGEVSFWTRQAGEAEEYQALIIDCKDCPANMEEWVYKYDKNFAENFEKKKAEMFEAWNRRDVTDTNDWSKERTAKAEWSEVDGCHLCGECGFAVTPNCDVYCAGCGARLEWE